MKALIAALMIVILHLTPATARDNTISGMIKELNTPGMITVEITVGEDDGVEKGDEFVVRRNKREVGKLIVISVHQDTAMANIVAVDEKLERGDIVVRESFKCSDN